MIPTINNDNNSYEENLFISYKIQEIFSESTSNHEKIKKLKQLQLSANTRLAQSQITYHLNKLKEKQLIYISKISTYTLAFLYFIIVLRNIYYLQHPEKSYYSITMDFSKIPGTALLCLIPLTFLGYYLTQYVFSQTLLKKYHTIIRRSIYVLVFFFILSHVSINYKEGANVDITLSDDSVIESSEQDIKPEIISVTNNQTMASTSSDISLDSFAGSWTDKDSQRCWLEIDVYNDTSCDINIYWSSNYTQINKWNFFGYFDTETKVIDYSGDQILETYEDDGTITKTFVYTDGKGTFYLDDNYNLHWEDQKENAGKNCIFENQKYLANTNWYLDYPLFVSDSGNTELNVFSQNDAMLCASFTIGSEIINWLFDTEPTNIDYDGNITYTNDIGVTMTFYRISNYLSIETADGLLAGTYIPLVK